MLPSSNWPEIVTGNSLAFQMLMNITATAWKLKGKGFRLGRDFEQLLRVILQVKWIRSLTTYIFSKDDKEAEEDGGDREEIV